MLTVLASHDIRPEVETIDRDPGIVSLLAAIVRSGRRGGKALAARFRAFHQHADEAALFSSSTAWPHVRR